MKNKKNIILAFISGLIIGIIIISLMTIPARNSYREMIQRIYIFEQSIEARKAIKANNKFKAIIHLTNELDADPLDGSNFINYTIEKDLDESLFGFLALPYFDKAMDDLKVTGQSARNKAIGFTHARLGALFNDIGYVEEAKYHWVQAALLLELPENKIKDISHQLINDLVRSNK